MISKICLGTVQFGLDYGIANNKGQVPKQEVFEIFKYAQDAGLKTLDTSVAYGDSEKIIGEFIAKTAASFEIVTKVKGDSSHNDTNGMRLKLQDSLNRLKVKKLYGVLIHQFEDFLHHDQMWGDLEALKKEGLVERIGFSLYRPDELEMIWDRGVSFDMVQIPFSILDNRFERHFALLKAKNIEIHARSVFLQGLAFLKPDKLPNKLTQAAGTLDQLQRIAGEHDLSISALCLNYVLLNPLIDKAVIGVDGLEQLKNNICDIKSIDRVSDIYESLRELSISDEDILLPFKWELAPRPL